jgi:alpha-D-xyloside xylohydrolase
MPICDSKRFIRLDLLKAEHLSCPDLSLLLLLSSLTIRISTNFLPQSPDMLGDSLLIAPIFSASSTVTYYLPSGSWYNILDQKLHSGPGYVTEEFDFFGLPVLLKPGGAIVMGKGGEKVEYDWADGARLLVNVEEGMDVTVDVPSHEALGEKVHSLKVAASGSQLTVEVGDGESKSAWELVIVNRKVSSADGGEVSSEGVVAVFAGTAKVSVSL